MLNRHFSAWLILPQSSISILSKDYPAKKQRRVGSVRLVGFFSNKWALGVDSYGIDCLLE